MKHIDINKIRRAMALVAVMIVTMASAMAQTAVNYIDKDGIEQTCETYIEVGTTITAWNAGWYLVNGEVVISGGVTVTGEVHLILGDGARLTVTGAAGKAGVNVSGAANSLTVYGQAEGTGKLTANGMGYANGTGGGAGIGGNDMQSGGNITVNGGIVTANGGGGAGIGGGADGTAYNIEINRGTVTANGSLLSTGIGVGATTVQKKYSFTVAENKTVEFSQGNLYYDGKDFKFEANQWNYASKWNTGHVSHFFWSKTASVAYAETYDKQSAADNDVFFTNAAQTTPNSSFTVEGASNTWRTLSKDEWEYLLNSRTPKTTKANLKSLTIGGTSNNVFGLVILPDNSTVELSSIANTNDLAAVGAVFLPAAGSRFGTTVTYCDSNGYYWSSAPNGLDNAYYLYFYSSNMNASWGIYRGGGNAVRLVREPKVPNTTATLTLNDGANTVAEALGVAWNEADVVNVYNGETNVGSLSYRNHDGNTATFTGYINENLTAGTQLTFRRGTTPAFTEQDGALATLQANYSLEGTATYNNSGTYTMNIGVPYALMKLDLSAFGTAEGTTVTIKTGSPSETVASITGVTMSSTELYVAMPAAASREYTFSGNGETVNKTWTLEANKFYTKEGSSTGEAIVVGPPVFSVSETKTVKFAPGNLYWDGSNWYFEANQWDYRTWAGSQCYISGTPATTTTPAKNCGLFKWGNKDEAIAGTTNNPTGSFFAASEFEVEGKKWFTLTNDEWKNLLGLGGAAQARDNASSLRKLVRLTVSGGVTVYGLVILPDGADYETAFGDGEGAIKSVSDLAAHGAVFLPAAGYRYYDNGTVLEDFGEVGYYWSSTPEGKDSAIARYFYSGTMYGMSYSNRSCGHCVRLVR